jgi:hypothetical protein
MMQGISFIDPDNDLHVNFAVSVLVIQELARNRRGKAVLNVDKFGVFLFLVSHPTILNRFILLMGGTPVYLEDSETESIRAMNPDVELVLDRHRVANLFQQLLVNELVVVTDSANICFQLSPNGELVANATFGWFLDRVRFFAKNLKPFVNEPASKILNSVIKCFKD